MVLIVGAGPAGLAMAYQLKTRHIPYKVIEREQIGFAWRNHYDNLSLHTLKEVSALPGWPVPESFPEFLPRAKVVEYLEQYAAHHALNIVEHCAITNAVYHPYHTQWHVDTTHGREDCDILILATGIWSTPNIPTFAGQESFAGKIKHASQYKNAQAYTGKRVLVIGGGNTGTEVAAEIGETADYTAIAVRGGTTFVPYPTSAQAMKVAAEVFRYLPDWLGHQLLKRGRPDFSHLQLYAPEGYLTQNYPVVGYELPEAVEAGKVEVFPCGIDQFTSDTVRFTNGREERFDSIVLATGYRPTVDFAADELELNGKGWPTLTRHWQSTKNERLYCVGFSYPNTEGWIQSIGRVTKQAANHIAKQPINR